MTLVITVGFIGFPNFHHIIAHIGPLIWCLQVWKDINTVITQYWCSEGPCFIRIYPIPRNNLCKFQWCKGACSAQRYWIIQNFNNLKLILTSSQFQTFAWHAHPLKATFRQKQTEVLDIHRVINDLMILKWYPNRIISKFSFFPNADCIQSHFNWPSSLTIIYKLSTRKSRRV